MFKNYQKVGCARAKESWKKQEEEELGDLLKRMARLVSERHVQSNMLGTGQEAWKYTSYVRLPGSKQRTIRCHLMPANSTAFANIIWMSVLG